MVDLAIAQMQVYRLDATSDFGWKSELAKSELIDCMMRNALSNIEAQSAVNSWLAEESHCPTPAELISALASVRKSPMVPVNVCPLCKGTGFVYEYSLCTPTTGDTLVQLIPGGFWEASNIRDTWKHERDEWNAENPGKRYKAPNQQYITNTARKCGCHAS